MKNNILAIDASTKRTGLATFVNDKLVYSVIESSSANVEKRIAIMRDGVINFIKENNIKEVVLEEVAPESNKKLNNHTAKVLTWLQGCLVVAIYEYDKTIQVNFIGASSWRSVLGIQGYRTTREPQKQIDINYANTTYGLTLKSTQDDEADAICILTAYMKNAGALNTKEQPKSIENYESAF